VNSCLAEELFARVVVEYFLGNPAVLVSAFKSLWKQYNEKEAFLLPALTELFVIFSNSSGFY